jgi:RimJ/RimL family protein N-acetyltransferase
VTARGALGPRNAPSLAIEDFAKALARPRLPRSADGNTAGHAGVGAVVEIAFRDLGLHRLEAGTLADNVASQRVLENNRFEQIGLARRYLQIAGEWRDHVLYQRTMA